MVLATEDTKLKLVQGGMIEPIIALGLTDLTPQECYGLLMALGTSNNVQVHAATAIALRSLAKQRAFPRPQAKRQAGERAWHWGD